MSETTVNTSQLNGVDLQRLGETVETLKRQPSLARFRFRNLNQWLSGGHNRSSVKHFYGVGQEQTSRAASHVMDSDEPEILLGKDQAPNPVEYLLHALAACMTTGIAYHAAARGIAVESIESQIEGDIDLQGFLGLDENVRPGFQNIRAAFKVKSDASEEQIREIVRLSPVLDTVRNAVNVDTQVEVIAG